MSRKAINARNTKNYSLHPLPLKEALKKAMEAPVEPEATEQPKTKKPKK